MTRQHHDTRRLNDFATVLEAFAKQTRELATLNELIEQATDDELAAVGFPRSSSGNNGGPRGQSDLTATERDAERTWQITSAREDKRDAIGAMIDTFRSGHLRATRTSLTTWARIVGVNVTTPAPPPECSTGQIGKHSAHVWGDPLCHAPAVKAGLCQKHYQAWYRARQTDGIDVTRDHEPAA